MKTIVFSNAKGGVGKTTLSVTAAAGLAHVGMRVLLIDACIQGHATLLCRHANAPCFYDLMVRDAPFSQVVRKVSPEVYEMPNTEVKGDLYLIPGNQESGSIGENNAELTHLKDRLEELDGAIDVAIIDTSPTSTYLHGVIYLASNAILIPVRLDSFSFDGMTKTIRRIEQGYIERDGSGLELAGIVPVAFNRRFAEQLSNLEFLRGQYGAKVWEPIPYHAMWDRAIQRASTVFSVAPHSKAAHNATKLAARVMAEVVYEA